MPRKLKPQKVDTVEHKGMTIPIMLNRNNNTFFAEVGGAGIVHAESVRECIQRVQSCAPQAFDIEWRPIIRIYYEPGGSRHYPAGHDCELRLMFDRCEMGRVRGTRADDLVERPHVKDVRGKEAREARRNNRDYFAYTCVDWIDLDYSDELWNGLRALHDTLRRADGDLKRLLAKKNRKLLPKTLAAMAKGGITAMALPSPAKR
jgi:hypothetical protein